MTGAQILSLFREYIDDLRADRFKDTRAYELLSEAQRYLQEVIDLTDRRFYAKCYRYSVVADPDAREFELPKDFKSLVLAERETTRAAIPARVIDFVDRYDEHPLIDYNDDWNSHPIVYLRDNYLGVVKPKSSYALRVWYNYELPVLQSPTDVSRIPAAYHGLIALHAAKLTKGETTGSSEGLPPDLQDIYSQQLNGLQQFVLRRSKTTPRSVHVTYDG